jgi:hypothetical protein
MRKTVVIGACILLAVGSTYFVFGAASPPAAQGKDVSITGRLSCTFCTLAHPEKLCTPECCAACVKAGDPPLLTDAQSDTFILLTREKGTPLMTPARLQMMGGQVTVKGLQVSRNGIRAIYVDAMEKAEAQQITVTGRLSCTFCTLANPDKPCMPECCTSCVKAGDPPSLTDAKGNLFLLLSGEKERPLMTPARLQMMGGQVTVKGLEVNRNGIRAIYVDSIQK